MHICQGDHDWNIGTDEERSVIAENKTHRDEFAQLTDEIIEYCKLECRYLAMLMTEFREVCTAAGISPQAMEGRWMAGVSTPEEARRTEASAYG